MDLFSAQTERLQHDTAPLAWRMRPKNLDEISGQQHLVGPGAILRNHILSGNLHSLILYGPSGVGKTTIAQIIAQTAGYQFVPLPAVSSGVADIRKIADQAKNDFSFYQKKTILFVDEIHRFNKGQQDVLLPYTEDGTLLLIGATTENPLYELNSALLSRMKLYTLNLLEDADIQAIIDRALGDKTDGLGAYGITLAAEALQAVLSASKGDARAALNILDSLYHACYQGEPLQVTLAMALPLTDQPLVKYDRQGDWHYDAISAFIKSVRGSDPDAAVYWLAVMLAGGEKPEFISRRLMILAAEDIGLADPQALTVVSAAAQIVHTIGMPEARIVLAEATLYLCLAPKSNTALGAIERASAMVRTQSKITVPPHIADGHHSKAGAMLQKGVGYRYPHDYGGYVAQTYLPEHMQGAKFYTGKANGAEKELLLKWRERKAKAGEKVEN
jgi:putative ATPase